MKTKNRITFRLTAYSDAAGKYDPSAPQNGNEDNFYVDDDLADDILGRCLTDSEIHLSDCGCLLAVADGMGGMNAGEIASGIAVATVKEMFEPHKVDSKLANSPTGRRKYLEQVIKEADIRIKADAERNPEHDGMGSTIILAWIVGNEMTVCWCGDSRAYRYNRNTGIELLSTDHSYVQELVNQGIIRYEDTFEHPQGNIITRSLGDPNNSARPETRNFEIFNGDIILLCSDGLSGVLRDRKTKDLNGEYYAGDNIEDIIAANTSSMAQCREALMDAAKNADWYDNVTVLLCQILSGAKTPPHNVQASKDVSSKVSVIRRIGKILISLIICLAIFLLGLTIGQFTHLNTQTEQSPQEVSVADSLRTMVDSLTQQVLNLRDSAEKSLLQFKDALEKAKNNSQKSSGQQSAQTETTNVPDSAELSEVKIP